MRPFIAFFILLFSTMSILSPVYSSSPISIDKINKHSFLNTSFPLYHTTHKDVLLEKTKIELLSTASEVSKSGSSSGKFAVKLNAFAVVAVGMPAFEFRLTDNFTLQMQALIVHQPKGFIGTDKPLALYAFFLEPRYYFTEEFNGFFVGINVGFGYYNMAKQIIPNYWSEEFNLINHIGWNIMGGATLGYSLSLGRVALEPYITIGYTYAQYDNYKDNVLVSPNKSTSRYLYVYNGGLNIVYKFGSSAYSSKNSYGNISRQYYKSYYKSYKGSRHNRRIFRKMPKFR